MKKCIFFYFLLVFILYYFNFKIEKFDCLNYLYLYICNKKLVYYIFFFMRSIKFKKKKDILKSFIYVVFRFGNEYYIFLYLV